jgi:ABC-type nickel/cobalt efflux system permease component RcnA
MSFSPHAIYKGQLTVHTHTHTHTHNTRIHAHTHTHTHTHTHAHSTTWYQLTVILRYGLFKDALHSKVSVVSKDREVRA